MARVDLVLVKEQVVYLDATIMYYVSTYVLRMEVWGSVHTSLISGLEVLVV